MINESMQRLGENRSAIREIFEYGRKRKAEIGAENVFDFSIGNPSIPTPEAVTEELIRLLKTADPVALHGYTTAAGDLETRRSIAKKESTRAGAPVSPDLIYLTCGAAASLTVSLNALVNPGDEVIVLAPYFPEYRVFAEKAGATVIEVPCLPETFEPDTEALARAISDRTKAVILNSPNNPTGIVYSRETLTRLSGLLREKEADCDTEIFLISDEPYRELIYGDAEDVYLPELYVRTLICYSYSKALSLPGERIGYILVPPTMPGANAVYAALCGAGRALGFVCAPSLMQYAIGACADQVCDLHPYRENRELLCSGLKQIGYQFPAPEGAFYLFVKSPEPDAEAFCKRAREQELLLVPSDSFGVPGYVRISYCVPARQIREAMPAFRALFESYRNGEVQNGTK